MKKVFIIFMLLVGSGAIIEKSYAQAWNQAQQVRDDSQSAANNRSNEGAKDQSSYGFDTPSKTPPPVRLQGDTPQLLRNSDGSNPYTPERYRSLHTTPPPSP